MRITKRLATTVVGLGLIGGAAYTPQPVAAQSASRVAQAALSRRMPEINLANIPLGEAIEHLRDLSQVNLIVNWRALAEAGVSRDTPINVRLHDVPLRKVLSTILGEAGAGTALTFTTDENVIEVTTLALADEQMYTRIYPIEDLIMDIPTFDNIPNLALDSQSNSGGGGGGKTGGGSSTGSIFQPSGNGGSDDKSKSKEDRAKDLVDLIISTIRPDSWRDNGGKASIRYFNGNLIVTAPQSIHELIGG